MIGTVFYFLPNILKQGVVMIGTVFYHIGVYFHLVLTLRLKIFKYKSFIYQLHTITTA